MEKNEFLPTSKFAEALGVQGASVRRGLCVRGEYMGIRPIKLPNNRLLWPKKDLDRLLSQVSEKGNSEDQAGS
jgi:hypothetical protein